MSEKGRSPSLRRDIVRWYSLVLVAALGVFTLATYLLLQQALRRAETASLRQTAQATEQLMIPPSIPRTATHDEFVTMQTPDGEALSALRRTIRLITGDVVQVMVTRTDDIESRALESFLLIALILIPLTAVAAAFGGRASLERLLEPLERLVDTTRKIGIGDLSRRVEEPQRPAELQELAQSFNAMLTRLEFAVGALSRFTADASHELRTPLTSIKGTVQVALARPRDAPELEETLAEVLEETEWMLHLVDGLLTLARGEAASVRRENVSMDLSELLADVAEVGTALAAGKPVRVSLAAPPGLQLRGSPAQLRQVLLNLVSNAVKFTDQGEVAITARVEPATSDGVLETNYGGGPAAAGVRWVVVEVRDTGPGIPPEDVERVFDRFYRGDPARARPPGTGLGLAIARMLVEGHGGTIAVDSVPGLGSTFRVRLPLPADEVGTETGGIESGGTGA